MLYLFEKQVNFPNWLVEGMSIESLFVNYADDDEGIAALSGGGNGQHILRLYYLIKDDEKRFFPAHELAAYSFITKSDLKYFIKKLPSMSAIELMMAMNPISVMPN